MNLYIISICNSFSILSFQFITCCKNIHIHNNSLNNFTNIMMISVVWMRTHLRKMFCCFALCEREINNCALKSSIAAKRNWSNQTYVGMFNCKSCVCARPGSRLLARLQCIKVKERNKIDFHCGGCEQLFFFFFFISYLDFIWCSLKMRKWMLGRKENSKQ